jgi:hypothetical protein
LPEFLKTLQKFIDIINQIKIADSIKEVQIDFGALRIIKKN